MRTLVLGGLCLLLTACATDAPEGAAPPVETREAALAADEGLPPPGGTNEACPGTRWVGVLPPGRAACPPPPNPSWRGGPLFADGDKVQQEIPAPFDRYCAYEWIGDGARPQARPPFGDRAGGGWLEADCHAVGAQSPSRDVLWRQFLDAHALQTGAVVPLPSGPGATPVRIAVADSATRDYEMGRPSYGQLEHGRAVALVARHFACPPEGGPCTGFVSNHLALTRDEDGSVNRAEGGYYGFQSELAHAIYAAVRDWKAQLALPTGQQRLVINLSVGWSPAYGGRYPNDDWQTLRPAVRAVHEAIQWARCNGALVIAAAGNATFGPDNEAGPLFPAGWEVKRAPRRAECNAMGDVLVSRDRPAFDRRNGAAAQSAYEALLFAASGVDHRDEPLHNARPRSRARLAAPAFHVVARDFDPGDTGVVGPPQPTHAYTGSSMAAAAVSGIAASVWAIAPDLAPAEVVELLHGSGVALAGVPAQFCRGGACGDVVRVSQCLALDAVCKARPGACGFLPDCAGVVPAFAGSNDIADPTTDADGDGTWDLDEALPGPDVDATLRYDPADRAPGCDGRPLWYPSGTAAPAVTCPEETRPVGGAAPWVGPQPDNDPCDICYMVGSDLYINISTALSSLTTLQDATLNRFDSSGRLIDSVRLDTLAPTMDPLTAGEFVKVVGLPSTGFRAVRSATMSFMNGAKPYSVVSPVLVY